MSFFRCPYYTFISYFDHNTHCEFQKWRIQVRRKSRILSHFVFLATVLEQGRKRKRGATVNRQPNSFLFLSFSLKFHLSVPLALHFFHLWLMDVLNMKRHNPLQKSNHHQKHFDEHNESFVPAYIFFTFTLKFILYSLRYLFLLQLLRVLRIDRHRGAFETFKCVVKNHFKVNWFFYLHLLVIMPWIYFFAKDLSFSIFRQVFCTWILHPFVISLSRLISSLFEDIYKLLLKIHLPYPLKLFCFISNRNSWLAGIWGSLSFYFWAISHTLILPRILVVLSLILQMDCTGEW